AKVVDEGIAMRQVVLETHRRKEEHPVAVVNRHALDPDELLRELGRLAQEETDPGLLVVLDPEPLGRRPSNAAPSPHAPDLCGKERKVHQAATREVCGAMRRGRSLPLLIVVRTGRSRSSRMAIVGSMALDL